MAQIHAALTVRSAKLSSLRLQFSRQAARKLLSPKCQIGIGICFVVLSLSSFYIVLANSPHNEDLVSIELPPGRCSAHLPAFAIFENFEFWNFGMFSSKPHNVGAEDHDLWLTPCSLILRIFRVELSEW